MRLDPTHAILLALGLAPMTGCSCGVCLSFVIDDSQWPPPEDSDPPDSEPPDSEPDDNQPRDADGDGVPVDEDCDDTDPTVHPDAQEVCDGVDNDCDGEIDEGVLQTFYADTDGDGYGSADTTLDACEPSTGWVEQAEDCDDDDETINPDAEEVCDGVDNDCDGDVDEGLGTTWYEDFDGDGYGAPGTGIVVCDACLTGYVRDATDCDDRDPNVNAGADEVCDGVDNDCDGDVDEGCFASNRAETQRSLADRGVLPPDVAKKLVL